MQHITFTHVDAVSRIPVTIEPAPNGPVYPEGAVFGFALESQYPTPTPTFYGWTDGETEIAGVLSVITKEQYDAAEVAEMEARVRIATPPPLRLTVGEFTERFDPESDQDVDWFVAIETAVAKENSLVRRQWANPATTMTENVGLWNVLVRIMNTVGIPAGRQDELLGRQVDAAAAAVET